MKIYNIHLVLIATMIISCSGESIWDGIVEKVTDVFDNLGLPHAGEPCAGKIGEPCAYWDGRGNRIEAPAYICKMTFIEFKIGKSGVGAGTCQMTSWMVVIVLALAVVAVLALVGCLCHCIGGGR